jgi:phosphatidylglycerophosphate synthase
MKDTYLRRLILELRGGGYGVGAWGAFWRGAWGRTVELREVEPRRLLGFWVWAGLGLMLGSGILAGAFWGGAAGNLPGTALGWLGWYGLICGWTWLHVGRIRHEDGTHFDRFLIPNGLSFLRLGLAPLVAAPILLGGPRADAFTRVALAAVLATLALSDLADGWIARWRDEHSVLGRVLDPMADLALLSFLAYGLWATDLLTGSLLALLGLRYPGVLVAAIILYILRGPVRITATLLGKITTAATFTLLGATAAIALIAPSWLASSYLRFTQHALSALVAANLTYLIYRAARW